MRRRRKPLGQQLSEEEYRRQRKGQRRLQADEKLHLSMRPPTSQTSKSTLVGVNLATNRKARRMMYPRPDIAHLDTSNAKQRDYYVIVTVYDRPGDTLRLLRDLRSSVGKRRVRVFVYDDASEADYATVKAFLAREGWTFSQNKNNVGKNGFASWVWRLLQEASKDMRSDELLVLLQDDMRLCHNFFSQLDAGWTAMGSPSLLIPYCDRRFKQPQWTGISSKTVGQFIRMGWTDCCFVTDKKTISIISSKPRARKNPWLESSGLGFHLSDVAQQERIPIYALRKSTIVHVGSHSSKMHPKERKKHPLVFLNFADGQRMHDALMQRTKIIANLASIPSRQHHLKRVVDSLAPQVDELHVYLNLYPNVPPFLAKEKRCRVVVHRSQDHGDRGDAGKFFAFPFEEEAYVLTCDDDIVYPGNYVSKMIRGIEQYGRRAIVTLHGALLPSQLGSYFKDRTVFRCNAEVLRNQQVQVPGTGVSAMYSKVIRVNPKHDFPTGFMADVHLSVLAHRQKVPIVVLAHKRGYLYELPSKTRLYSRFAQRDYPQTRALQEVAKGKLCPLRVSRS